MRQNLTIIKGLRASMSLQVDSIEESKEATFRGFHPPP
jgi:hypothetical protein